jgi:hypothetical protein
MNCTGGCLNGGLCSFNNTCVCASCFAGTSCEVDVNAINVPLTWLILWDIDHAETTQDFNWPKLIYIFVIAFMLLMSIINNIVSLQTFLGYEIRQTNCGIYQILFSLTSLMAVITLQLRVMAMLWFDYLTEAYAYRYITCNIMPITTMVMYDTSVLIATLLAIEFVLLECFNFNLNRSRWLSIILSIIIFLITFSLRINILVARRPISDSHRSGLYTCIFIHPVDIVTTGKIALSIHALVPTIIQLIASLCLLISITRRIGFVFARQDFVRIFLKECRKRKHFFVPLLFTIFTVLPHLFLHLRDECEDARDLSILRLHLSFNILAYLPQSLTFFIYIYPSASYMNNFKRTWSGRLLTGIFNCCNRKEEKNYSIST